MNDTRTWVEKFKDGDYTAEFVQISPPDGIVPYQSFLLHVKPDETVMSEGCDYAVMSCTYKKKVEGNSGVTTSVPALWGFSLTGSGKAYTLAEMPAGPAMAENPIHGLSSTVTRLPLGLGLTWYGWWICDRTRRGLGCLRLSSAQGQRNGLRAISGFSVRALCHSCCSSRC